MSYVDGYVLPIPQDKVEEYRKIAQQAGEMWKEHGALAYKECVGEDLRIEGMKSFLDLAGAAPVETVVFAYIVFSSREHRDEVNAKVMADPRLKCNMENMPFDHTRMAYGGFKAIVDL